MQLQGTRSPRKLLGRALATTVGVNAPGAAVHVDAPAGAKAANEDNEGGGAATNVDVPGATQVAADGGGQAVGTPWATVVHTPGGTAVRVSSCWLDGVPGWTAWQNVQRVLTCWACCFTGVRHAPVARLGADETANALLPHAHRPLALIPHDPPQLQTS